MDSRRRFLHCMKLIEDGATQEGTWARGWKSASKAVGCTGGKSPVQGREPIDRGTLRGDLNPSVLHCQEKLLTRQHAPVPKPTQVGGERILRCAGKPSLRNSAKCIRNFGRRMAGGGEAPSGRSGSRRQKRSPSDCLPQTQVPAKEKSDV